MRVRRQKNHPIHTRILSRLKEALTERTMNADDVADLEESMRSITDRKERTNRFADLGIVSRKQGNKVLYGILIRNAVQEARGIRPLAGRSCMMCSIAMKLHASGCERESQEFLEYAIDAATDIKQPDQRDEIFGELNCAIRIMQGGIR